MSLFSRLKGLLQIRRLERDLDEELRSHIEMRTADNVAAGMPPEEARYDAQRRFGNTTLMKEDTRAMDIVGWLETAGQNLRYAARMLKRSPGFTVVAILTLALGIGANVAIFTVVRSVVLSPLPYVHPEQLLRVYDDLRGSNSQNVGMSVPELWDLREKSGIFQDVSVVWPFDANLTGGERPERLACLASSPNYFTMLGVSPQLGRVFTEQDAQPGFTEGILISDALWHRMFGADPNVLGRKMRIDSDLYTVIGVLPPGFRHPGRSLQGEAEVFTAAGFAANPFPAPPLRSIRLLPGAMGRLKPGVSVEQAQARLNALSAELSREYPSDYPAPAQWSLRVAPVQEDLVGNVGMELFVLFGAVALVLLIACVNLANLLLARSAGRQREIAIRLALGAGRMRLIGQLLTESILLASISGLVALLTVIWFKGWLLRLAPADLPRLNEVNLSAAVLLFALAISVVTGVLFGLVPALQAARRDQLADLREGSRGGAGSSKHQLKVSRVLVTSEIALSLVLLIGAGLLLRSFWHLLEVRPGFEPHHLLTARMWLAYPNDPAQNPYRTNESRAAFLRDVLRRVSALPGVEDAALGSGNALPMEPTPNRILFTIDKHAAESERVPTAEYVTVTPEFFRVLKIPLIRGRVFAEADDTKGQPVALINETLARRYWHDEDPVGQQIRFAPAQPTNTDNPWRTIVGVIADIKSNGFDAESAAYLYIPTYQRPSYANVVYLRTSAEPGTLGDTIRREVQAVNPSVPVFAVRTMDEVITKYLSERRFALDLLGVFAGVALLLASIGIYGVMAYTFSRRINEIGIRMAMGARRLDIFKMALAEGTVTIAVGVVAGVLGSLVLTRFLQTMLFSVKPADPATFATIAVLLAGVTLLACLVPAHRATHVDPLIALRHE